jgi:hypothetical protein
VKIDDLPFLERAMHGRARLSDFQSEQALPLVSNEFCIILIVFLCVESELACVLVEP